eukprot:739358-Pelagomonas_calceolata.AAC.9
MCLHSCMANVLCWLQEKEGLQSKRLTASLGFLQTMGGCLRPISMQHESLGNLGFYRKWDCLQPITPLASFGTPPNEEFRCRQVNIRSVAKYACVYAQKCMHVRIMQIPGNRRMNVVYDTACEGPVLLTLLSWSKHLLLRKGRKGLHRCTCLCGQLNYSENGACNQTCLSWGTRTKHTSQLLLRIALGYIAVPAYKGSCCLRKGKERVT